MLKANIWKQTFRVSQRGDSNAAGSWWAFQLTAQMWSHGAGVFNPSCSLLWCKARLLIKPIRSGKKKQSYSCSLSNRFRLYWMGPEDANQSADGGGGWQEMINDYWSEAKNNMLTHQYYQPRTTQRSPRGIILIISNSNWGEVISATQKRRRLSSAAERRQGLRVVTDTKCSDNSTKFFWCQRASIPSRAEASGGRKKGGRESRGGVPETLYEDRLYWQPAQEILHLDKWVVSGKSHD